MSSSGNSFNPSDYELMLKSLTQGNYVAKAQSLKKLNTLVTKDKKQFSIYAKRVVLAIQDLMFEQKEDINLLSSTLALQIININPRQIQYYIRSKLLKSMVQNLGDSKPSIRKTSHYCLLAYVKTYKSFDELIQVYLNVGVLSQQWQLRQKAINSLQSIMIMEMKYINWGSNQFKRVFQVLLMKLKDQNAYVQKATQQCLLSLCKIEEIRSFSKKLAPPDFNTLRIFCQTQHSVGTLPQIKLDLQSKVINIPSYRNFIQSRQQSVRALGNTGHSLLNLQKIRLAQQNSQKRAILNRIQQIKRHNSNHQTPKIQKQQVQPLRKADSLIMVNQLKQMKRRAIQRQKQRLSEIKLEPIKKQSILNQKQTIESKVQKGQKAPQNIITRKLIDDLKNDKDWKVRLQAIQQFQNKFETNKQSFQIQTLLKTYLPILIKLLADANFKVALIALKILEEILLMPGINIDLIAPHLIQKLSDNKIALRQNISKLIRSEFIRTKQNIWIDSLLTQLKKSNNSNTKQQILSILNKLFQQDHCSNYSIPKVIETICPLMDDLKTKIKIKTLDLLVLVTLKSKNSDQTKNTLMGKLNQVYYEMYSQKLNKQMKNKNLQSKQPSLNLSTQQSNPISSSRQNRVQNVINKRYSKNSGNTTATSLQREKNSLLNPNQTVRTSSFIERSSKRDTPNRKTQEPDNTNSKISLHDPQISSPSKANEKKKSFLKSFRKKVHRTFDNKSTNYSAGQDYQPFDQPQKQLRNILVDIKSQDWQVSFQALNKMKIIICHHKQLLTSSVLKTILPEMVRLIQNLRSSLSKNAVMTLNQLSMQIKRGLDSQIDMIFNKLIKKSLDANSFISEEVKKVLVTICSNGNQSKVVTLLTASHITRAIPIKQVIVHILQNITFLPKFYDKQLQRIVVILNNFMGQGSLQIRQKTKALLNQILSSDKGKQMTRIISPEHLAKLKKLSEQKIPELKIIDKQQQKLQPKRQQTKQTFIETGKKKKQKINIFPDQFNKIQGLLQKCQSSDWKIRSQSMSQIHQIYNNHPEEASQHRLNNKIIDVLTKQMGDPNVKVATNALRIFKNITNAIPSLIENNLSVISNQLFTCFASQKQQVKNLSEQLFDQICQSIQSWMLLQHMCNGVLYGIQKSKSIIIQKLVNIVSSSIKTKTNIFQKNVYPMINKTVQEGKPELVAPLKKLLAKIYEQVGQSCFDHLKPKSKQIMKT